MAGPDDESAADAVLVIGGPDILRKLGDSFRISQEIDVIERQQHVIAVRDDHPVIAENHSDQDRLRQAQILQRDMEKRGNGPSFVSMRRTLPSAKSSTFSAEGVIRMRLISRAVMSSGLKRRSMSKFSLM